MLAGNEKAAEFIINASWEDFPKEVQEQAKLCTMDLLGAVIAGSAARVSKIMTEMAVNAWPGKDAAVLMSGKKAGLPGAVLANASMANALDVDDGFRQVKGHPGAVVFPAVLAAAEKENASGREFLTALVAAYEIAIRAGLAWHRYHSEYHGTGSWGSLGAAAGVAKIMGLDREKVAHALGTAEYHAPIMPMMRCIDYPAMTKDGIGWGSMVGTVSAMMAAEGFTGIPSLLGMNEFQDLIGSLWKKFEILGLYFKPFCCCRWAQPAVTGILQLREKHNLKPGNIESIIIRTFKAAARLGMTEPSTTEEAQYSMAYPVAAALVEGEVGPRQVLDENLHNRKILSVIPKIHVIYEEKYENIFPEKCTCEVEVKTTDGKSLFSGSIGALGDPGEQSLGEKGLKNKFRWLAGHCLEQEKVEAILSIVEQLQDLENIGLLVEQLQE